MESEKKLNILILSWRGPGHPHVGGAEIVTHEHAKGWVKEGHNVTLFTSSFRRSRRKEIVDGVNIIRRGSQIFGVHWQAFKWYLLDLHPKYDLVVDQFHGIPFFTPVYVKAKKLALIHEVTKEVWALNPWPKPLNLLPATIGTMFEPLVFKLFYRKIPFMTVSKSTKDDLVGWGIPETKITVIHNGLNPPQIKKIPTKEKRKTAIFLGALSKDKGIEDAIRTFSIINRISNNWQFWIVGKGEQHYLEILKSQCHSLNIGKKVKFWGHVKEGKKFELLSRAHVLINPSIREGWGLVVIEAASVGTPTVGFDVPGLRDSIINGKTGVLSECNPQDLATKVLKLLKDNDQYETLRKNCVNWAKRFSWGKSVNLSLRLIENLVKI